MTGLWILTEGRETAWKGADMKKAIGRDILKCVGVGAAAMAVPG